MAQQGNQQLKDVEAKKTCAEAQSPQKIGRLANVFTANVQSASTLQGQPVTPMSSTMTMSVNMRFPPKTDPKKDTWYMDERQPNWTPETSGFKASAVKKPTEKMMQVQAPSRMDDIYVMAAAKLGETPAYQPPPPNMKVTGSPYKWGNWF